jgi:hypothetical protein
MAPRHSCHTFLFSSVKSLECIQSINVSDPQGLGMDVGCFGDELEEEVVAGSGFCGFILRVTWWGALNGSRSGATLIRFIERRYMQD